MHNPMSVLRRVGNSYHFDSPLDACFDTNTDPEPLRYQPSQLPQIDPIDAKIVFAPGVDGGFMIGVLVTPLA